jgi:hypothetical protein
MMRRWWLEVHEVSGGASRRRVSTLRSGVKLGGRRGLELANRIGNTLLIVPEIQPYGGYS